MPRELVLGNGNILICLDHKGQVKDLYFPYVGTENHVGGRCVHKIGVWVDEKFSWLEDQRWHVSVNYKAETLVSDIIASNKEMELELRFSCVVYNEKNIFLRKVNIANLANRKRQIRIFFNQQLNIHESNRGNTAYYYPDDSIIVHYKGRRVFVVGGKNKDKSFDSYSIGLFQIKNREGTWRDAEDGVLSQNPIEFGSVDSVIGFHIDLDANKSHSFFYWLTVGKSLQEARELHSYILKKTPEHLMETTEDFWHAWVNKSQIDFSGLNKEIIELFKKSLLIIRTHMGNNGSIIASGDSDMLQYGQDTYSYVWLRDAAFTAMAMDWAGYFDITKNFFQFCNEVISEEGYFFHKYNADKSIGSSWHPWVREGKKELPIQEDETALVLHALWKHYSLNKDLEFIENIYNSLIKRAAEFLNNHRDIKTGLPQGSYDLWEQKFGTATFTAATVYAGLRAAENFAKVLGKEKDEERYRKAKEEIKEAIFKNLVNEENGYFYKLIEIKKDEILHDKTVDISSFYGIFKFLDDLEKEDTIIKKAAEVVKEKLCCKTSVGGVARYEGDDYFQVDKNLPGNPWIITSLWMTQYKIKTAKSKKELDEAFEEIKWVAQKALPSGIMSEQIHPYTGAQLSAAPLIWSHAEFITTVLQFLEKRKEIG